MMLKHSSGLASSCSQRGSDARCTAGPAKRASIAWSTKGGDHGRRAWTSASLSHQAPGSAVPAAPSNASWSPPLDMDSPGSTPSVEVVSGFNNITTLGSRLAAGEALDALQPQVMSGVEELRSQLQAAAEEESLLAQLVAAQDAQHGLLEQQLQAAQARQVHGRRAVAVVSRMQEEVLGMAESNYLAKQEYVAVARPAAACSLLGLQLQLNLQRTQSAVTKSRLTVLQTLLATGPVLPPAYETSTACQ